IETAFPILDTNLKQTILDLISIQLNDNVKARRLDFQNLNEYKLGIADLPFRSQTETYFYFKRKN
ncbi:MAG: hypothetical protein RLZZ248_1469, partial [Bacteroidota bacterium]